MSTLFDSRQVRRAFSRASSSYADAAKLQHEIEARLLEALDYYAEGRVGQFVVREPLTPGHEASGVLEKVGSGVKGLAAGMKVAVNPDLRG